MASCQIPAFSLVPGWFCSPRDPTSSSSELLAQLVYQIVMLVAAQSGQQPPVLSVWPDSLSGWLAKREKKAWDDLSCTSFSSAAASFGKYIQSTLLLIFLFVLFFPPQASKLEALCGSRERYAQLYFIYPWTAAHNTTCTQPNCLPMSVLCDSICVEQLASHCALRHTDRPSKQSKQFSFHEV